MSFLGVETSLTGRRWIGPAPDRARAAEAMAQQTILPPALCQTLARLGVANEAALAYLEPTLRDLLPDPRSLRDMEKAATRFLAAVKARQRIAVFADYEFSPMHLSFPLDFPRSANIRRRVDIPVLIDIGFLGFHVSLFHFKYQKTLIFKLITLVTLADIVMFGDFTTDSCYAIVL